MVTVFHAKHATVKIDATGDVTLANDTVLDTQFSSGTTITGQMKDVSVTIPMGDVEKIDLLGTTAQDGTSYQNAELEEKPAGLAEISGTLVLPGDELIESEIFGSGTSATTHTTYEPGQSTKTGVAFLVNVDDGTDEVSFAGNPMYITEYNPSAGSADGHFEVSVTLKALPKNFFMQFKD